MNECHLRGLGGRPHPNPPPEGEGIRSGEGDKIGGDKVGGRGWECFLLTANYFRRLLHSGW